MTNLVTQLRDLVQRFEIDKQLRAPTIMGRDDEAAIREAIAVIEGAPEPKAKPATDHDYGGLRYWAYKESCECGQCRYARKLMAVGESELNRRAE